jgi:hypothetical protein
MFQYSLVLMHNPFCQDIGDFETIASLVRSKHPQIEVFIIENDSIASVTRKQAAKKPSLIFSPGELGLFTPKRGKILAGRPIPKIEQMERMRETSVSTPDYDILRRDGFVDVSRFGPVVIVKSGANFTSHGKNVFLVKSHAVPDLIRSRGDKWAEGAPWIVQKFIEPEGGTHNYRVLNLLGENLLAYCKRSTAQNGPLENYDDLMTGYAHQAKRQHGIVETNFARDPDVLATATSVGAAFPDIPLRGCDIVREKGTGKCYVLEINPGGNTWIFSKPGASERLKKQLKVEDIAGPQGSFTKAADALAKATYQYAE